MTTDTIDLARSEERLRLGMAATRDGLSNYSRRLIEASLDPLVTISTDGRIMDVNAATEGVTGRPREELIGSDFSEYFTEPMRAAAGYRQVFSEGSVTDYPLAIRHADGHVTDVLYNASVYRNDAGEIAGVFAAARDITLRKRAEQAVRELNTNLERTVAERTRHLSEALEFQQTILLNSPLSMAVYHANGQCVLANEELAHLVGAPREALLAGNFHAIPSWRQSGLLDACLTALRQQQPQQREINLINVVGKEVWFDSRILPIRLNGEDHLLIQLIDFTHRKQAEEKLRETNAYLQNLINYANAPIIVWDPQFRITRFNRAFEFLSGRTEAEVLGQSLAILFPSALCEDSMALIRQTLNGQRWEVVEIKIQHRDGSQRTVLWNSATLFAPDGQTPLATIAQGQDITERKHAEDDLARAKEAAEAANRAKSEFLANMSHEIRTPLNAILGFAQVLVRDQSLNAAQRDSLTTIHRSGEHLLTLINDILDMAKIEAGRMSCRAAPFDLTALVAETAAFFQQRATDSGLTLTVEAALLPGLVVGDAMRLRQVLINLMSNAIKFTKAGRVSLRVAAAVGEVRFSVDDTGVGIAGHELERLFEPFSQTASGRQVQGGTGLGLALSRQFVRLMGGELTARSTPGQGSCFSFALRLPPADGATSTVDPRPPVTGLESDQPACRVLIVDDQQNNREPLRALLDWLNPQPPVLEFREAANGQEAVAVWEAWQPQVIFMDMRMPVLSGQEAIRQIKARMAVRPDAVQSVVVGLSASAFDENRDQFLAGGCDDFARKPFQAENLFDILERHAGLRFVRAAAVRPAGTRLSTAALAARLAACPLDWQAALHQAVALGEFDRITSLVEQLGDADPALREVLSQWAYNFDADAFSTLLNRCEYDLEALKALS
ncbi:PAS domain S-box protein [uncultured Lamprocystis sp.]|jgi:PAS domain S-box-containing protein|uniref:PAS domain S-box protein n=1 Tax=uncultured Lamprocystis sp. TaxID=543132 RepID=UPI0025FB8894|nr:PAS domain S-box protein [uncultured Lamprocystis sp.]